jgi:hypothetical protein
MQQLDPKAYKIYEPRQAMTLTNKAWNVFLTFGYRGDYFGADRRWHFIRPWQLTLIVRFVLGHMRLMLLFVLLLGNVSRNI